MPSPMKLSSNRSIVNCRLTSAHDTCILSLSSSTEEIKRYFKTILAISKMEIAYPVNFDSCWMLCYSAKDKAVRALKENFIEGVDYQLLAQNGERTRGGQNKIDYYLSVSCLEYFIARKVRPVFDVYREVFHKTAEVLPKVAKSSAADKRRIAALEKELERTRETLRWTRIIERQEVELKCSCFHYLVKTKQYDKWEEYRRTGIIKR
nr:MAG TPA: AntA/AntB antirepressor [Caudoviricetes sp.]